MLPLPRSCSQSRAVDLLVLSLVILSLGASLFYNGRHPWFYAAAGIASILVIAVSVIGQRKSILELGPAGLALVLFTAWTALGIFWSVAPYMSVIELGVVASGLALYVTCRSSAPHTSIFPVSACVFGIGTLLALTMLVQAALGFTPRAMLLNPNSAAGFLNFVWPIAALAALRPDATPSARNVAYIALFLMIIALAIDGSRGAMLGAIVGLCVITFVTAAVFKQRKTSLGLVALFTAGFVLADWLGGGLVTTGIDSMRSPTLAGASRLDIWGSTWEMVRQNPWLGFGPGAFWIAYPAFRSATDQSSGYFVHNDYLEFWVEGGLPLLVIAVLLGAACLYLFIRSLQEYRHGSITRQRFHVALSSFAGILGVATHSVVTFNLQLMPFVLVAAMLLAALEQASSGAPIVTLRCPTRPTRLLPIAIVALVLLIPVAHFARTAVALEYIDRGSGQLARDAYSKAATAFSRSRLVWSQPDGAWYMHANVLVEALRANPDASDQHRRALVSQAERLLDRAEERNPLRATTPLIRGLLRADHPDLTDGTPETSLRRALHLNPRNIEARYALSQVIARNGDLQKALHLLKEGLTINYSPGVNTNPLHRRVETLEARIAEQSPETAPLPAPDSDGSRSRYY